MGYLVRLRCTVLRDVYCSGCTKKKAIKNPFKYATHEIDASVEDWEVLSVYDDSWMDEQPPTHMPKR